MEIIFIKSSHRINLKPTLEPSSGKTHYNRNQHIWINKTVKRKPHRSRYKYLIAARVRSQQIIRWRRLGIARNLENTDKT